MNTNKVRLEVVLVVILLVLVVGAFFFSKSKNSSDVVPPPDGSLGNNTTIPTTKKTSGKAPSQPPTPTKTTSSGTTVLDTFGVDFVSPISGGVGTTIVVHGNSFSSTGNTVVFNKIGRGYVSNLSSPDGKTITLKVPATLMINGKSTPTETGTYDMSVRDARGKESNLVSFVVTAE